MSTKGMCWLLDTAFNDISELNVIKSPVCFSLKSTEGLLFRGFGHKVMAMDHHNFHEQLGCHVIDGL